MPRSFGEPLTKLRAVPIEENGEPLVDPRELSRRVHFVEKHPKFPDMSRTPQVRRRVAEMLAQAAESLPVGVDIQIVEGFRPLAQQRFMYGQIKAEYAQGHPEWSRATLHRMTNIMSAPRKTDAHRRIPGWRGGPLLIRMPAGELFDMTSPLTWDETNAPTRISGLSPEAQANRDLLIETLQAAGLTKYAGEWWHWSYGDSGWALRVAPNRVIRSAA